MKKENAVKIGGKEVGDKPAAYKALGLSKVSRLYLNSTVAETNAGFELEWKGTNSPRSILMLEKEGYVRMVPDPEHRGQKIEMPVSVSEFVAKTHRKAIIEFLPMLGYAFKACRTMYYLPLKLYQEVSGKMYWQILEDDDHDTDATHIFVAARLNPDGVEDCKKEGLGGSPELVPKEVIYYPTVEMSDGEIFDLYIFPKSTWKMRAAERHIHACRVAQRKILTRAAEDYADYHRRQREKEEYGSMSAHRSGFKCDGFFDGTRD